VTPFAELIRISELLRQASVWQRGLPAAS
jgi:hypothetical protein